MGVQYIVILLFITLIIFCYFFLVPYLDKQYHFFKSWFLLRQVRKSVKDKETQEKLKEIEKGIKKMIKDEEL